MTQPGKGAYSEARYQVSQVLPVKSNVSMPGTAASDTELARIRSFTNIRTIESQIAVHTGGTAAGPILLIGKSAAGTGAFAAIGTQTIGTSANNTIIDVTLTETDFDDGDDIVIQNQAGTAASTPVVSVLVSYAENFVSD